MSNVKKICVEAMKSNLSQFDLFICCSSFEQRCLSVSQKMDSSHFTHVIIFENANGSERLKENTKNLLKIFPSKITTTISHSFQDVLFLADAFVTTLNSIKKKTINVLIDVSTFTHELLLICLKILNNYKKTENITCLYLNAKEYCPNVEREKKWLSYGCQEVHSILGYPGMLFPSQKTHLIIIVGYEYSRAFEAISILEPNSISLIYGCPENSTTAKDKEANGFFTDLVSQMAFEYNSERFKVKCDDPQDVCDRLNELFKLHEEENIIVIPMNNKMSTIGVAQASFTNEHVQLCYAPAIDYNESNYSIPGEDCYIFDFKKGKK